MNNRTIRIFGLAVLLIPVVLLAKDRQTLTFSEPLDKAETVELQVDLGFSEISLARGSDEVAVALNATIHSIYREPIFDIERRGDTIYALIESKDHNKDKDHDDHDQSFDITLSGKPELAIRLDVGLSELEADLTGLKVTRFDLDSGLASAFIGMNEPNSVRADRVTINSGLGDIDTEYLGNLRFNSLEYDGGLGSALLDLRGFEGEGDVSLEVGMGSVDLVLPRNVGVRVYYEDNFFSSVDLKKFTETDSDTWESEGYHDKKHHLTIDMSVGMGSVDIDWE